MGPAPSDYGIERFGNVIDGTWWAELGRSGAGRLCASYDVPERVWPRKPLRLTQLRTGQRVRSVFRRSLIPAPETTSTARSRDPPPQSLRGARETTDLGVFIGLRCSMNRAGMRDSVVGSAPRIGSVDPPDEIVEFGHKRPQDRFGRRDGLLWGHGQGRLSLGRRTT